MRDARSVRRCLLDSLADLNGRVERIEGEQAQTLDDDFAEQAVAREDDEALDAVERSALTEIAQLRAALARLDAGSYGLCVTCGESIAPARLHALPAATQCIRCARRPLNGRH